MTTFADTVERVKTPSERGEFGAWLVEQRKALGERRGEKVLQRDVVAQLAAMGFPIEESYYRALEGGSKRPGRELRERLATFYGEPAPTARQAVALDTRELALAIQEQTAALSELALRGTTMSPGSVPGREVGNDPSDAVDNPSGSLFRRWNRR